MNIMTEKQQKAALTLLFEAYKKIDCLTEKHGYTQDDERVLDALHHLTKEIVNDHSPKVKPIRQAVQLSLVSH